MQFPYLRRPVVEVHRLRQGEGPADQVRAVVHAGRPARGFPDAVVLKIGDTEVKDSDAAKWNDVEGEGLRRRRRQEPVNWVMTELILVIMVLYVTMVYGPIAAFLVELFPTKIRYTSMSLPYHIGNGWFGGMLPLLATAMVAASGDIYYGLWYPIIVALMTFVIGLIFLRDRKEIDLQRTSPPTTERQRDWRGASPLPVARACASRPLRRGFSFRGGPAPAATTHSTAAGGRTGRVALLSDIHANLRRSRPASRIRAQGAEAALPGDYVGGADAAAVVDRVMRAVSDGATPSGASRRGDRAARRLLDQL
jgi:hypothetical protein